MSRYAAAMEEIAHGACGACATYNLGVEPPRAHLAVLKVVREDNQQGQIAFSHQDPTVSAIVTRAAAIGPIALIPDAELALHINSKHRPSHSSLSDVDKAMFAKYNDDAGTPQMLLAQTFALLEVTGADRLRAMSMTLIQAEYAELSLFELFPQSRIEQALKRVPRILHNADYNPGDLMRRMPQGATT